MINSMTGFGHGEKESSDIKYSVEIKTINHRFLDINIKLPQFAYSIEDKIQSLLKEYIKRGKVDVIISIRFKNSSGKKFVYDKDILDYYINISDEIKNKYNDIKTSSVYELLRLPGVIIEEDNNTSVDTMYYYIKDALKDALEMLLLSRKNEGYKLQKDIENKLIRLKELSNILSENAPLVVEKYKENLKEKLENNPYVSEVDENRLATELIIFADKICIDEEIVRLNSHISFLKKCIENDDIVGRKMDFIIQELNREANTLLSKSTDILSSDIGIEMKTLIEKIREQVQNLE